ncbi:hypothetical protein MGU_06914 [Metarhizium guizhouense ARSEF 977]|uniref:Uncharacterized protein n=1 Tax=Metarhizium guizhouense (strain ARSEF 977) TaxID=1276136 RepID=A0A0B4H1Y6_METGA|nr:hypothetical protein MGU_06914 [Metarhizium guizhouense ARSEF 977]
MEWVEKQLKWLQEMDPHNKLLVVWCRYPDLRTGHDPFDLRSRFWMCLDSSATPSFEKLIPIKIKEERFRMAGRMTVFACGDAYFTALMRDGTIKILKDKPVKFLESEYQSRSLVRVSSVEGPRRGNPRKRKKLRGHTERLELQNMANNRQTTYSPVSEGSFYSVKL